MILLFIQLYLYKKVWFIILKTIILCSIIVIIIINKMRAGFLLLIFIHHTFKLGYDVDYFFIISYFMYSHKTRFWENPKSCFITITQKNKFLFQKYYFLAIVYNNFFLLNFLFM